MGVLNIGAMDRRIRIERSVADEAFDGAGSAQWSPVATVWAEVRDLLPSRGEKLADGLNVAARPSRVRIRWRRDVTSAMRILIGRMVKDGAGNPIWQTDRTAQIITVPAELGRREGLEFVIEDYSTAGSPA